MVGGTGDADGGRTCIAPGPAADVLGVPGVPGAAGCFSFLLRGTLDPRGGPPGVPGKGCLRGRPLPRCGVGPGVTPGVPGVPGAMGVGVDAVALALALLLLGGLDGVAAGVDGVPGMEEAAAVMNGADVGVAIACIPFGITSGAPGIAANGCAGP